MAPSLRVSVDAPELPTIHLNGNSVDTLLTQYFCALKALEEARDIFCRIDFHPRDYYPKGPDSFSHAQTQRHVALHHIDQSIQYLESHVEYLSEQSHLRTARNTPRHAQN